MKDGKIIEQGTHEELLKEGGFIVICITASSRQCHKRITVLERIRRKHPKQLKMDSWKHQMVRFHLINSE